MFTQLFRWIFCPQTGMDVDAESRSGEPHPHLAEEHCPLHRWQNFALFFHPSLHGWQNFAFFALFLHPPPHRLQYFSSFQNFAFFSSQAWRVVGRPIGISYGRCSILDTQIMTNIPRSLEFLKPRGTLPQTTPTRRTIFWGPCLALARFGCSRSTSICRSSRGPIKFLQKEFITKCFQRELWREEAGRLPSNRRREQKYRRQVPLYYRWS